MREPSLQATVALSAVFHVTVFLVSMLVMRQSNNIVLPSPYFVSLVGPSEETRGGGKESRVESVQEAAGPEKSSAGQKDKVADQELVEKRISELRAKEKIKTIVELRKKVLAVKARDVNPASKQPAENKGAGKGGLGAAAMASYTDIIIKEIHSQWFYPETGDSNLETIVAVKIMKDGTISIQGMEKSSGNRLFDNSALKAVRSASPVTRPPYEMEIGIRFYP
jgi:colicin import membrane protein